MSRHDLVLVGDVHLDRGDPLVAEFVRFLDRIGPTAQTLVLIGDLFNLWIGRREFEQPHHRQVAERLAGLRREGTRVCYVEGNRDFRVADRHQGTSFDRCADAGLALTHAGHRIFAIHGDMCNATDRVYRAWRTIARSRWMWWLLNRLPATRRYRFAEWLERRLQGANLEFKREPSEDQLRAYAAGWLAEGNDTVVMGHFHVERDLTARPPSPPGRIVVLPLWRETRRYLRVDRDGQARFETAGRS